MTQGYEGIEDVAPERLPKLDGMGNYTLEVTGHREFATRKFGDMFLAEFKILESDNENFPAGSEAAYKLYKNHDMFLKNLASYARPVTGLKKLTKEDIGNITSEADPTKGVKLRLTITEGIAQKSGKPFPLYNWRRINS